MLESAQAEAFTWSPEYAQRHPLKTAGIVLLLIGRYLFGAVFIYGWYHKTTRHWLTSPTLRQHFLERLSEIDPASFQAAYLRSFAIPWYRPIAWFIVLSQLSISASMMLGLAVRPHAALALFLFLNFIAGAYVNPSLAPFIIYSLLLMKFPTSHWLGVDEKLHQRYPKAPWFR